MIALNTIQFGIFKKLYVPGKNGIKKDVRAVKEYVKDITKVLGNVPKKYGQQVLNRVYGKFKDISQAMGAEAGQEYLQTWHEILSVKMEAADLASFEKEFFKAENIDEATFGLLAGGTSGATIKGAASVPGLATGTALDATLGATQGVAQYAKNKAADASFAILPEEQRAKIKKQYKRDALAVKKFKENKETQIAELVAATSIAGIKSEETLAEFKAYQQAKNITDETLKDPDAFKKIANKITAIFKASVIEREANLEATNAGRITKRSAENITKGTVDTIKKVTDAVLTPENIAKVKAFASTAGNAAIEAVKNIESSAGVGLVLHASGYTNNLTRKQAKELKKFAEKTGTEELRSAIRVFKIKNPEVAYRLEQALEARKIAENAFASPKNEINRDTIPKGIKGVLAGDTIDNISGIAIANDFHNTITNSRIADLPTVRSIANALRIYRRSDAYKNQEEGSISKSDMAILQKQLTDRKNSLNKLKKATKGAKSVTGTVGKVVTKSVKKATKSIIESVKNYYEDNKEGAARKVDELADKIDKAADRAGELVESGFNNAANFVNAKELRAIDNDFKGINDLGDEKFRDSLEAIFDSMIDNGIVTKADFVTFFKKAAPKMSSVTINGAGLISVLSNNYVKEVKKYQDAQSQTETDTDTIAADEAQIDHDLNGEKEVPGTQLNPESGVETKALAAQMGIKICGK